jgi:tellurite methyltransferase
VPDESSPEMTEAEGWQRYYAATRDAPPAPLLVWAVRLLPDGGDALDLGCGAGNDVRYLLRHGFQVTAVDAQAAALDALAPLAGPDLRLVHSTFADFAFEQYDLVNAQLSLPFNPPDTFAAMFERLKSSLKPGGIFAGSSLACGTAGTSRAQPSPFTLETRWKPC